MKKSKQLVRVLLAALALSAVACLFSFGYVSWQGFSRQKRLDAWRDFSRREKAAQALEQEYRAWQELPQQLQKFRENNIRSMDEFAVFRRQLDARLAANGLRPPRIDLVFGNMKDKFRKVTLKFSLEGSYRELKKFIYDMEVKTKMHYFSSIQLSAGKGTVKGAFMLEVFLGE